MNEKSLAMYKDENFCYGIMFGIRYILDMLVRTQVEYEDKPQNENNAIAATAISEFHSRAMDLSKAVEDDIKFKTNITWPKSLSI